MKILEKVSNYSRDLNYPLGGYLTRQISFLLNNFRFEQKGSDDDNPGLLIPRYMATGRTAPNGKVYPEVSRKNEDDYVLVRSIITKRSGKKGVVTPDLLSKNFLKMEIPDKSAIGLASGTAFTESTTQGILGLKHGGHERESDQTGNLYAPKDCTLVEDGKWLKLKVRGGELKYPRPENWVVIPKEKYTEGDLIGTAYNTTSPTYKLNAVLKLMQAKGSTGAKYFEKDNVIESECYSYGEGKIEYRENKRGDIEVWIGDTQYTYNPESMYYYPEGTMINKYQRFCSGVVNMRRVANDLGDNISGIFNIFRKQYYTLTSSFQKDGYVSPKAMQEELVELVFAGLTSNIMNPMKEGKVEGLNFQGTQNSILNRKSFFTTLSYGWSSRVISRAMKGDLELEGDTMTETVLGLLLNDQLDNNGNN